MLWFILSVRLQTKEGGYENAEEDHRGLVAWALGAGSYLGHKRNLSVETTWEVAAA